MRQLAGIETSSARKRRVEREILGNAAGFKIPSCWVNDLLVPGNTVYETLTSREPCENRTEAKRLCWARSRRLGSASQRHI